MKVTLKNLTKKFPSRSKKQPLLQSLPTQPRRICPRRPTHLQPLQ